MYLHTKDGSFRGTTFFIAQKALSLRILESSLIRISLHYNRCARNDLKEIF